jgi:hypothetical protein
MFDGLSNRRIRRIALVVTVVTSDVGGVVDGMTLFGIGLVLGGCMLLAAASVGYGRARRADRVYDDEYDDGSYSRDDDRGRYERDHRQDERRPGPQRGGRARQVAPPRIQRSALLAKTVLLGVVRADVRRSRVYETKSYDGAARNVSNPGRRDPYRRNPPLPPPPARRLPLSKIPTRENSYVPEPPRNRTR